MVLTDRLRHPICVVVPRHAGGRYPQEGVIGDVKAGGQRRGWIGPGPDTADSAAFDGRPGEQGGGAHVSSFHATFRQRKCERVPTLDYELVSVYQGGSASLESAREYGCEEKHFAAVRGVLYARTYGGATSDDRRHVLIRFLDPPISVSI